MEATGRNHLALRKEKFLREITLYSAGGHAHMLSFSFFGALL